MLRKITFSQTGMLVHRQPVTGRYFRIISAAAELRARLFNQQGQVILDTRVRSGFFIQTDLFTEIVLESEDTQAVEYWASEYPLDDKAKNKGADSVKSDVALLYGGADKIAIKESRQALTICPSINVYVGGEGVTPQNGIPVAANERYRVPVNGQVFVTTDTPARYAINSGEFEAFAVGGDSPAQNTFNNEVIRCGEWLVIRAEQSNSQLTAFNTRTRETRILDSRSEPVRGFKKVTPYSFQAVFGLSSTNVTAVNFSLVGGEIIPTGNAEVTPYQREKGGNGFSVEYYNLDDEAKVLVNGVLTDINGGQCVRHVMYDPNTTYFYLAGRQGAKLGLCRTKDFASFEVIFADGASGDDDFGDEQANLFSMSDNSVYLTDGVGKEIVHITEGGAVTEIDPPTSTSHFVYEHTIIAMGYGGIYKREPEVGAFEKIADGTSTGARGKVFNDDGQPWLTVNGQLLKFDTERDYSKVVGTVRLLLEQVS